MKTKLQELVAIWYSLMVDHHKDRDCHFYIFANYRYDGQVVYSPNHEGYIIEESDCAALNQQEFPTLGEAERALQEFLVEHIKEEAGGDWMREHFPDVTRDALARLGPG